MKYLILLIFLPFASVGQNFFWSHNKPNVVVNLPTVTTTTISSIGQNSAYSGGNVTSDGGGAVTARGVAVGTSTNPQVGIDSWTTDGTGTGSYTSYIWTLSPSTLYYVRAYATNSAGTAYGSNVSFTTANGNLPTIATVSFPARTSTTVTVRTYVSENLGGTVTEMGTCWSTTNNNPTISDSHKSIPVILDSYQDNVITGLTAGTYYYFRNYATNANGTAYYTTPGYQYNTLP